MTLEGSYQLPVPPPSSPTPWWLWFSGGALAVGVGIATALWVAGRNTTPTTPGTPTPTTPTTPGTPTPTTPTTPGTPTTTTAPGIAAPTGASPPTPSPAADGTPTAAVAAPYVPSAPTPTHPALIEVRFDSTPSASVFADGQSTELCRTPCAFDIDPSDGGPTDHRGFVVRRAGYVDRAVSVDLAGTEREFRVTLQHAEPGASHPRDPRADAKDSKDAVDRHVVKRPGRPAKKPGRGDGATDARPEPTAEPGATDARPAKKPAPPIDPTDTLDPFRKK